MCHLTSQHIAFIRFGNGNHHKLFSNLAIPIDFVITPEVLVTNFIKRVVEQPGVEQIFEFDNGLMQLVEFSVSLLRYRASDAPTCPAPKIKIFILFFINA
jgi:Trk K+ transport system NAD-binding subunit